MFGVWVSGLVIPCAMVFIVTQKTRPRCNNSNTSRILVVLQRIMAQVISLYQNAYTNYIELANLTRILHNRHNSNKKRSHLLFNPPYLHFHRRPLSLRLPPRGVKASTTSQLRVSLYACRTLQYCHIPQFSPAILLVGV